MLRMRGILVHVGRVPWVAWRSCSALYRRVRRGSANGVECVIVGGCDAIFEDEKKRSVVWMCICVVAGCDDSRRNWTISMFVSVGRLWLYCSELSLEEANQKAM